MEVLPREIIEKPPSAELKLDLEFKMMITDRGEP